MSLPRRCTLCGHWSIQMKDGVCPKCIIEEQAHEEFRQLAAEFGYPKAYLKSFRLFK